MGVKFSGDWNKQKKYTSGLIDFKRRVILSEIGEAIIAETMIRFQTEKDPQGKRWKKLKQATIKARGRKEDTPSLGSKILQDTGLLKASIVKKVSTRKVEIGTNEKQAKVQQFGYKPLNIPSRKYLPTDGFSARENETIDEITMRHMSQK